MAVEKRVAVNMRKCMRKWSKLLKKHPVWVIADMHWGHENILRFRDDDNVKIRPWDDILQMEEDMIEKWNNKVENNNYIIVLGDAAMNNTGYERVMPRLNGIKTLVMGNHDVLRKSLYLNDFEDMCSSITIGNIAIMTHIPIHPGSLFRFSYNIHGHTHNNSVLDEHGNPDLRYKCVSVEQTNFEPILLNDLIRGDNHEFENC